jgi:hypothetical protein
MVLSTFWSFDAAPRCTRCVKLLDAGLSAGPLSTLIISPAAHLFSASAGYGADDFLLGASQKVQYPDTSP